MYNTTTVDDLLWTSTRDMQCTMHALSACSSVHYIVLARTMPSLSALEATAKPHLGLRLSTLARAPGTSGGDP